MKVLFDTNLWISFMIGKRLSSLSEVLCQHDIQVYVSEQLLDEIRTVIARPKFDNLIAEETRFNFFEMVYDVCILVDITVQAESPIRDIKDLYLLSMAESVPVDYSVSGDKDLLALEQHSGIPIMNYSDFVNLTRKLNTNKL